MNIRIIMAILQTFFGKDTRPGDIDKPLWEKRRVQSGVLAIVGILLYEWNGMVIDNDTQVMVLNNFEVLQSSVRNILSACSLMWATYLQVKGQTGLTKKAKDVVAACNEKPAQPVIVETTIDAVDAKSFAEHLEKKADAFKAAVSPDDASG